jgi:hypothetical protein
MASGCICGRRFLQEANDGTCLTCGHGLIRLRRLPRNLGALVRRGQRLPRGVFENTR